jgi:signal transduction histidine kinase
MGFREFPHIVIAARHEKQDGDFYVLRMTLDTKKFNGLIGGLRHHSSSDIFLVNNRGVIQTPSLFYGSVLEQLPFPLPQAGNRSDITEIEDEKKRRVILGYALIKETPFTLLVIKPPMELMEKQQSFLGELAGFLAISIIIILAVIFRVSSIMVGRIEEADHKRVVILHQIEQTSKLASIGRLSAGVAHEINNPLAIINEKAGLLKDIFSSTDNLQQKENFIKIVDSILKSVERCSSVTYRLLGFARHIDVLMESIDPVTLIQEVLDFLGKEAEFRNIEIMLSSCDDLPSITSDRGQLQQVFLNIINNAVAAVGKDGHIDIDCNKIDSNHIAISIEDDGVGIPPEQQEKIFEPFFTTKGREGTGLGLSITYGIVKKLGGKIEVESEVKRGTKFIVTLPIIKP